VLRPRQCRPKPAVNAERTAILRDAQTVAPGERVHVTLERGQLECNVITNHRDTETQR
jgi:hypothetical protein